MAIQTDKYVEFADGLIDQLIHAELVFFAREVAEIAEFTSIDFEDFKREVETNIRDGYGSSLTAIVSDRHRLEYGKYAELGAVLESFLIDEVSVCLITLEGVSGSGYDFKASAEQEDFDELYPLVKLIQSAIKTT